MLPIILYSYVSVISKNLRLDKGTETGQMATIHGFLRQTHADDQANQDAVDTVQYGPQYSMVLPQATRYCECNAFG